MTALFAWNKAIQTLHIDKDVEFPESFYDQEAQNDMNAIAAMLARSEQEGLQCEVVYQFAQEVKNKAIPEACYHALEEWIK